MLDLAWVSQLSKQSIVFLFVANCKERCYQLQEYFTFSHLADAFIQSDLQMKTLEAIKTNKEQQHASAMTSLG